MKVVIIITGVLLFALMLSGCYNGCGKNYSSGSRAGVVTKLSNKGLICKSWEGEMLMALPASAGTVTPEKFIFNVAPESVESVTAAMKKGERVELVYHQWAIAPFCIDSEYVVVDVK